MVVLVVVLLVLQCSTTTSAHSKVRTVAAVVLFLIALAADT
jgi:hypothetical protein